MSKSPRKTTKDPARPTRAKASKPRVEPLSPHLAALLNPGLIKSPNAYGDGFEEAAQAAYDPGSLTGVESDLAAKLGLDKGADAPAFGGRPGDDGEPRSIAASRRSQSSR